MSFAYSLKTNVQNISLKTQKQVNGSQSTEGREKSEHKVRCSLNNTERQTLTELI